jgi:excisionase family DNA binding protein
MSEPERLLSIDQLAAATNLPKSWLYSRAESGTIPHFKLGRYLRFKLSEIEPWLAAQHRGPSNGGAGR